MVDRTGYCLAPRFSSQNDAQHSFFLIEPLLSVLFFSRLVGPGREPPVHFGESGALLSHVQWLASFPLAVAQDGGNYCVTYTVPGTCLIG